MISDGITIDSKGAYNMNKSSNHYYRDIVDEYYWELKQNLGDDISLFIKWKTDDFVFPFSDVDMRIILNDYGSITDTNYILYEIHKKMVAKVPFGARILEHPYGFLYFTNDASKGILVPDDIKRCSFANGNPRYFEELKKAAGAYSMSTSYISRILDHRFGKYNTNNEYVFKDYSYQKQYSTYCLLWHYYIPCVYAFECLKAAQVYDTKINLEWYNNDYLKQIIIDYQEGFIRDYSNEIVLREISNEIECLQTTSSYFEKNDYSINEAICMLRIRICRILYYLNPPSDVNTDYLIRRELKELSFISSRLHEHFQFTDDESFSLLQNDYDNRAKLMAFLEQLQSKADVYEYICWRKS